MVCHKCGGDTAVINSRPRARSNSVWRRRQCVLCDTVCSTNEVIDYSKSIVIRPRNSKRLQPLNRDKLLLSLHASLAHRPTSLNDAAALCETIILKAVHTNQRGVVSANTIIDISVVALSRFDKLAAQHYKAMHL